VILKSLVSVDSHISAGLKKMPHKKNCFELLGFDILLDSDMKPWLMEVNLSPSLATESPLDLKIKSNLFIDTMNLVCIKRYDRRKESINKIKNRVKNIMRAKSYQSRQTSVQTNEQSVLNINRPLNFPGDERRLKIFTPTADLNAVNVTTEERNTAVIEKVSSLNKKMREIIKETLIENTRRNNFIRIYPTKTSHIYDKYFAQTKPVNTMLQRYLFSNEIIPFPTNFVQEPLPKSPSRRSQQTNI